MLRAVSFACQRVSDNEAKIVARSMLFSARKLRFTTSHRLQLVQSFTSSPQNALTVNDITTNKEKSILSAASLAEDTSEGSFNPNIADGSVEDASVVNQQQHVSKRKMRRNGTGVVTLKDGDVYKGDYEEGLMHGEGKLIYANGGTFEGAFKEGKVWTGKGVCTRPSGAVYEGELKEGKLHGQGKLSHPDGRVHEGEFQEGKMHGKGKRTYLDGRTQEGEFREGIFYSGFGTIRHKDSIMEGLFTGEIRSGKKWNGAFSMPDGTVMKRWVEGEVVSTVGNVAAADLAGLQGAGTSEGKVESYSLLDESKKLGKGQIKYPDGSVYEGGWLKNKKDVSVFEKDVPVKGKGVLPLKEGGKYEEKLRQPKRHGQGKLTYPDGRTLEGEFREGKIWNGVGALVLKDGSVYEGAFRECKHHGQGKLTYPDGRSLEGEFREGKLWNGRGIITHKDGAVYGGEVKEGKMHGKGHIIYPNGRSYEGEFREGKVFQEGTLYNGVAGRKGAKREKGKKVASSTSSASPLSEKVSSALPNVELSTVAGPASKKNVVSKAVAAKVSVINGPTGAALVTPSAHITPKNGHKKHGKGVLPLKDGGKYEGELVQGMAKVTNTEGVVEEVEFAHGKKVRSAKPDEQQPTASEAATAVKSSVFSGGLKQGKRHGQGKLTYPDGRYFKGEFKEGKIWEGKGVVMFGNGNVFVGEVNAGNAWSGKGALRLKDGNVYEGELREGKRHGQGKLSFTDGTVQEGKFDNNQFVSGYGSIRYKDGSLYDGSVQEGKRHDQGKMLAKDGAVWEGRWEADAFVEGALTFANGEKLAGTFQAGTVWSAVLYNSEGGVKLRWVKGTAVDRLNHVQSAVN